MPTADPVAKVMQPISATGIDRDDWREGTGRHGPHTGFTLVELLIVLALAGVLSVLLAPMLLPSAARTVQQAGEQMLVGLRESRRLARASRQPQQFLVDTAASRYRVAGSATWRSLPDDVSIQLTTAESLLSSDSQGAIGFFADGSSSGGRIVLGLDGIATQIDVEWLTGRTRISGR